MKNVNSHETLEETNAFFDNYFDDINLNEDLKKIYDIINDQEKKEEFEENVKLTNLRNDNYKNYTSIDLEKFNNLPKEFDELKKQIKKEYDSINLNEILNADLETSKKYKNLLNHLQNKIKELIKMVVDMLDEVTEENDRIQATINLDLINDLELSDLKKKDIINKYNELVMFSSNIDLNFYKETIRQFKRREYIEEILKLMSPEISEFDSPSIDLNSNTKNNYYIVDESKYLSKIKTSMDVDPNEKLSDIEIPENIKLNKRNIVDENIEKALYYIKDNYIDTLDDSDKNMIYYLYNNIDLLDSKELEEKLNVIIKKIWNNTITDIYTFNPYQDYCFICSNNQFIDAKYQTILITRRTLEGIKNYHDYQIGFVCSYNNNILYVTEQDDIMNVEKDNMSKLKTPGQIEQELIDYDIKNKIALDGYNTHIEAVYFIDDGNHTKYIKALELANMYNLPLIQLKRDNN